MRNKLMLAAFMLAGASAAGAMPPPVPVAPVVIAEETATAGILRALIADMSRQGHFDAAAPEPAPPTPRDCAEVGEVMRATCYATAARAIGNPNLVFLFAEPSSGALRLDCVGPNQDRAQRAELDLAVAAGEDAAAARPQRQALASCLIGALHAPAVPRPLGA
ncbi:hypothetical protein [Sphingosinicella terrae]|uniref:hypothetical protein n=1 Tax=Sphingosinicella terrae TaxID=2172047 RepID=UPI000E0DE36C|nr:hypothetical protein [Sphingosinicella terrae]